MPSRNQIATVAGLVLLAAAVQVVTIRRATVTGLDAVGFVRSAKMIDQHGLVEALRGQREQPLFPVSVWTVHRGIEWTVGDFPSSWALSTQLAAAVALVLSVVPVYFVARRLAGATAAAWGSALYCILPEASRLGADGISDALHLLFFCLALWMVIIYLTDSSGVRETDREPAARGVRGTKCGNPLWLLPAGIAAGLAVLVRVEGLILPAALILALALFQYRAWFKKGSGTVAGTARRVLRTTVPDPFLNHAQFRGGLRQRWRRIPVAVGVFGLGFCLIIGPYLVVVDSVTPKVAIARVLGRHDPPTVGVATPEAAGRGAAAIWYLDDGRPMSFAKKEPTISLRRRGLVPAACLFVGKLVQAYGYWVGLLALAGAWRLGTPGQAGSGTPVSGSRLFGRADRFLQVYFLLFSAAAYHFAVGEGYVSARHLLPLVVVGIGAVGCGVEVAQRWLAGVLSRIPRHVGGSLSAKRAGGISTCAIVAALIASSLIEFTEPVHASREGHRKAAAWLALDAQVAGAVLDTRGWTGLYSGRTTYGYEQAQAAFKQRRLAYVVLEDRELQFPSERSQTLKQLLDVAAEPVTRFAGVRGRGYTGHAVVVYRWNAQRFSGWLDSQAAVQQARGT